MKRFIAPVAAALALFVAARSLVGQDAALARTRALLAKVPLIDGHNDLPWTLRETYGADLSRVDPAFVSAATAAWGKGLENSLLNAKTNSAVEKMEKDYAAVHGPAPAATLAQVATTSITSPASPATITSASAATSMAAGTSPKGWRT